MDLRILDRDAAAASGVAARIHEELLVPSFRPEELGPPPPPGHIPGDLLLVATDEAAARPLGCAIGEFYPASGTLLLGYLAVRPGARGHGVGSALMRGVLERWCDAGTFALAEVDDPRHHDADDGYGDPWARLRFYGRFGLRAFAAPYFQPSLGPGYPRSYHLLLCHLPPVYGMRPAARVEGARVHRFLREYFAVCEGEKALDDPEVVWLLSWYHGDVDLVPLPELGRAPDLSPPGR